MKFFPWCSELAKDLDTYPWYGWGIFNKGTHGKVLKTMIKAPIIKDTNWWQLIFAIVISYKKQNPTFSDVI